MNDAATYEAPRGGALAFVLTLFFPGLGHGLAGHPGRGTAWVLALLVTWCAAAGLSLLYPSALLYSLVPTALLVLACAIDAARRPKRRSDFGGWLAWGLAAGVTFFAAPFALRVFLRLFVVEAFKLPSGGMCPTFFVGDHVLVDKTAYRTRAPARGDVIVHSDELPGGQRAVFVRRVVGLPGDELSISAGRVTVNGLLAPITPSGSSECEGQPVFEEELGSKHAIALDGALADSSADVKLRVPEGSLFLIGDNRMNSHDSRQTGPVAISSVIGRVSVVWLSQGAIVWRRVR